MENRILYDWITFTTKIHSVEDIIYILGLIDVTFVPLDRGMNGYPFCLFYAGISICYGGRPEMGICVNMSGEGCRSWETYGNGDYKALFDLIIENYSDKADKRQMNLTRLDVAYDDFEGILDIFDIYQSCIAGGYDYDNNRLYTGNFVTRFSTFSALTGSKGLTCDFGSVKSDVYIRIYDKKAEQGRKDIDHWVRVELQLRRENAIGFILLTGNLSDNYFGVLNNYLRFVTPDPNDSNKRRWKSAEWWDKFLETHDRLSIYQKPGTDYDVLCLDGYVYTQCAAAVKTMIDLVGLDVFLRRLNDSVNSRPFNPKYKALINQLGTSAYTVSAFLQRESV